MASYCGKPTNYTRMRRSLLPGVMKAIRCLGSEDSAGQCMLESAVEAIMSIKGLPPGATQQLDNAAWVSCKRMTCVFIVWVQGVYII